jgi:hypothetical protein
MCTSRRGILLAAGEGRNLQVSRAMVNLGRVADDLDVESFVFRAHLESRTDEELEGRLREFAEDLVRARSGYLAARGRSDVLVPEDGTA